MTIRSSVASALAEAGAMTNDRTVDEVLRRIPVEATPDTVMAADVRDGMTVIDVIAAIRAECRLRAAGLPSTPRPAHAPAPVDPLAPPPPASVRLHGLAAARAALTERVRDTALDPDPDDS